VASQLTVDEHRASRLLTTDRKVVGRDQALDDRLHLTGLLKCEKLPALGLVVQRAVMVEGQPLRYAINGDGFCGRGDAGRHRGGRCGQQLAPGQPVGGICRHFDSL